MSRALYRKYRPKTFSEVIGQESVKTILKNAVKTNRVSHAYLFAGPRGVGKTTAARILAKAVNCLAPKDGEPDTLCENCRLVQEGRFLDLIEIDAASYTGVDNIRDVIDHVKFTPSIGKFKVFIIDEVHMLSKAAFNALLKTLEEPPQHAIFILATTEIYKVPATIISRTQRFDFRSASQADILKLFDRVSKDIDVEVPLEAQKLVARSAEGSLRDALSILDQILSFSGNRITLEDVETILGITRAQVSQKFLDFVASGSSRAACEFVKNLSFEGKDLVQFSRNLLEYLRLVLFVKMDLERLSDLGLIEEDAQILNSHAQNISAAKLLEIIKKMLETHREIKSSPVPELPLLAAALTLASEPVKKNETLELGLGTIIDKWAEVLSKIKEYNHSLISSLRLGRIIKLEGQDLTLAFPYNFHKETIESRKNRIVVEQVLADIFEKNLRIKVVLEKELKDEPGNGSDLMTEAIKVLGENNNV